LRARVNAPRPYENRPQPIVDLTLPKPISLHSNHAKHQIDGPELRFPARGACLLVRSATRCEKLSKGEGQNRFVRSKHRFDPAPPWIGLSSQSPFIRNRLAACKFERFSRRAHQTYQFFWAALPASAQGKKRLRKTSSLQ